jgi:hypothetical protein
VARAEIRLAVAVAVAVAVAWLALGCSAESDVESAAPGPSICGAGEWSSGGPCVAAGLPPDLLCPPGETALPGGGCVPAGVPPGACGAGFVHDGDAGCSPVLPQVPCGAGELAVPGETRCHAVAPCGTSPWGDVPIEPGTHFVDQSYAGGGSDGSDAKPWTTINLALAAAAPGALVAVAAGIYGDVYITGKPARIWGRCPELVSIAGTGAVAAALRVDATGSEIHRVAVHGKVIGVAIRDSESVLLDRLWIHDNALGGVQLERVAAPTSATLRGSLVEGNVDAGITVGGAAFTVQETVVRDTKSARDGQGIGLHVEHASAARASLVLKGSIVERSAEISVFAQGADVTMESTLIRETRVGAAGRARGFVAQTDGGAAMTFTLRTSVIEDGDEIGLFVAGGEGTVEHTVLRRTGGGIQAREGMDGASTALTVRGSLVEQSRRSGIQLFAPGSVTVEGTLVRDVSPRPGEAVARGISAQGGPRGSSALVVRGSRIERVGDAGISVAGGSAVIEGTLVRDALLAGAPITGRGISAQPDPTGAPSDVEIRTSSVERTDEIGVVVFGSRATLERCEVRDAGGAGVHAQAVGGPAELALRETLVAGVVGGGVVVVGSTATLERCAIREASTTTRGGLGDGVIASHASGDVLVRACRIDAIARAALSSFGARLSFEGSRLACHAFAVDAEPYAGSPADVRDLGGNACGCPEATGGCRVVTSTVAPPEPPPLPTRP